MKKYGVFRLKQGYNGDDFQTELEHLYECDTPEEAEEAAKQLCEHERSIIDHIGSKYVILPYYEG